MRGELPATPDACRATGLEAPGRAPFLSLRSPSSPLSSRLAGRLIDLEGLCKTGGAVTVAIERGLETRGLAVAVAVDAARGLGLRAAGSPG